MILKILRYLMNVLRGAHWPITQLDLAGNDLAHMVRLFTGVGKRRNEPGAGYDLHVKATRSFLVFLVAVGLGVLDGMYLSQPWPLIATYVVGSLLFGLVPPEETGAEVMANIMSNRVRPWWEWFLKDYGMRIFAGILIGNMNFFVEWMSVVAPQVGFGLRVAWYFLLMWAVYRIWWRERIRKISNMPLR